MLEQTLDLTAVPAPVTDVWDALGHETVLVGGAVRDWLGGVIQHDWDLATPLTPDGMRAALAPLKGVGIIPTGERFGTLTIRYRHETVEVTTFRRDGRYTREGRAPERVAYTTSLEEDLKRRDFTMNAMAVCLDGTLVDPFHGRQDLEKGVIRAVGDPAQRLTEDPLRMWRAVRFLTYSTTANGGPFVLETALRAAIHRNRAQLVRVSLERQRHELWRILESPLRASALWDASRTGILALFWPEWVATMGFDQENPYHHFTLDRHLLEAAARAPSPPLALAGLLHDIAKPVCLVRGPENVEGTDQLIGHFPGHDDVGAQMVRDMLHRTRWSNRLVEATAMLVAHHMFPWEDAGDHAVRGLIRRVGGPVARDLLALHRMDVQATQCDRDVPDWAGQAARLERLIDEVPQAPRQPILTVTGHQVMRWAGVETGPRVGEILRAAEDWVLEDPTRNTPAQLEAFIRTQGLVDPP